MSYSTVETALATVIKKATGYSTTNVASGDYRVLAKGNAKAVVLQPGSFEREYVSTQYMRSAWAINVELYVLWGGEQSTVAGNIRTERQALIDKIDQYPTLDSATGVVRAILKSAGPPEIWQVGAMQFWKQIMVCQVEERTTVTYA
ncbi:MAG: hypothetical protein PHQ43_00175 [Dehalococcoidales bacterium]|nr:hypothetical protein [Dehalococcoidales bacterium]